MYHIVAGVIGEVDWTIWVKIIGLVEWNEVRVINCLEIKRVPSHNSHSIDGNIEHQKLPLIASRRRNTMSRR
jgi:hypothetical protein